MSNMITNRRKFIRHASGLTALSPLAHRLLAAEPNAAPARSLFDGKTLNGWRASPRLPVPQGPQFAQIPANQLKDAVVKWHEARPELRARLEHTGSWEVVDGAIVGGHSPVEAQQGAYLLTEQKFADFELELDARPDWPIDTGIMVRAHELGSVGFQVLLDHRPKGGVGGVYGNSVGNFLAAPFTLDGDKLPNFRVANLREGGREPNFQAPLMNYAATFADFSNVWKANDWNHFRIRCVGRLPLITTWINGLKICELDTAKIETPNYDAEAVFAKLGRSGHIGFEIHDVNLNNPLGQDRWATGAVCRWRHISITEL